MKQKNDILKIQRLIKVLQLIDNRSARRRDLAHRFNVTERQIYRDIYDLCKVGFPVAYDKQTGTYHFREGYSLKKIALTQNELQALMLSKDLISSIGGPLVRQMETFHNKLLAETVPTSGKQKIPVTFKTEIPQDFSKIEKQYNVLLEAIKERIAVKLVHYNEEEQKPIERELCPYKLFYSDGFWYVLGYCRLKEDIRTFALDRIEKASLTDRHFIPDLDFNPDDYLSKCWKTYALGEPEKVTIKFSPSAARQIKRKQWHPSQEITENKDGSLNFSVTVSGYDEIMRWVLSWGEQAEVLGPAGLREGVRERIGRLNAVYRIEPCRMS